MHVGVTGASGLIGRSLLEALGERGDRVTTFVRPASTSTGAVVRWDPSRALVDEADLARAGGFDAVVHLAGAGIGDHRWSPSRQAAILSSRVQATTLLVSSLRDVSGASHLVSASAIGWYGDRGDETLDEASPKGEGFLSNVCDAWERAALAASDESRVTLLRTGLVVSTRGGFLKSQLPLFRLGLGGRLGSGRQWMSPIALKDEVRAILWVLDQRLSGPVNLCAPRPLTNRDFTKILARELHRPAIAHAPSIMLRTLLGAAMANELILTSQRVTPRVLNQSGFTFDYLDTAASLQWALTSHR